MENEIEKNSQWASHEIKLLNHVEVFLHKPGIMKKAEQYLNALGDEMIRELAQSKIPFPPETKLEKIQLTRGENHKGFPYLSLDIPQMFTKTEMFTYRTLFWWGHYLGFSLILKGKDLTRYADNLLKEKNISQFENVFLATATTPWEWSLTDDNFKNIHDASAEELQEIIETIEYIKLMRFYPINDKFFAQLDWVTAGISTWRDLSIITEER
jgi:hypothetical protein